MYQSVKLTDAIWLLQLVISSSLINALGDLSQAHTRIWTWVFSLRGGRLTNWAIPPPEITTGEGRLFREVPDLANSQRGVPKI